MILLDGGSHRTGDADAVAPHHHRVRLAIVIEVGRPQSFTVLGPELEDLADFDALRDDDLAAAVRADIAFLDLADGVHLHITEIAGRIHMDVVFVLFIGSAAGILHFHDRLIADDVEILHFFKADRTDIASRQTAALQIFFRCHIHIDRTINILELYFIDFMIAAHHRKDDGIIELVDDRFDGLLHIRIEEVANHLDRVLPRGFYDFLFLVIRDIAGNRLRIDRFDIRCEITVFAIYDIGFAGISQHFEFMRRIATDRAGVCDDRTEFQTAAGENAPVCIIHQFVLLIETFLIHIEGVAVLHDEFAASHQAETRTLLIAVLILDLIDRDRQLLVGRGIHGNERRHQFFMCRSQTVVSAVTILQLEHFFPIYGPASRLLPDLRRLYDRHQDLLCACLIDLLTDDLLHFLNGAESQRQVRIGTIGDLSHHAGFQHVLMAHDDSVGRQFSQGRAI